MLGGKIDESKDQDGRRRFVRNHIEDCERVLQRLEEAGLTFSGEKSSFGQRKLLVVGEEEVIAEMQATSL